MVPCGALAKSIVSGIRQNGMRALFHASTIRAHLRDSEDANDGGELVNVHINTLGRSVWTLVSTGGGGCICETPTEAGGGRYKGARVSKGWGPFCMGVIR